MRKAEVLTLVVSLGILLLLALTFKVFHVYGLSMEPGVHNNQMVVVEKYWFQEPERGDIIVFRAPPQPSEDYVKRIIGLPGDIISINGASVTVDGITLSEPYVSPSLQGNPNPNQHLLAIVPTDEFFVLGDDRRYSDDSRDWGFVPRGNIVGHVVFLFGSPDNTSFLPDVSWVYARIHPTGVFQTSFTPVPTINFDFILLLGFPDVGGIGNGLLRRIRRKNMQTKKASNQLFTKYRNAQSSACYQALHLIPPIVMLLLLCGCNLIPPQEHRIPTHIEQPMIVPYQPFRIVQLCLDTPPLYPARFSREAAAALADRINSSVTVNFGGLQVYVSYITSDSFQNSALQFEVSGFPPDPVAPRPPTLGNDPYQNADMQQAYQKAYAAWQATLIAQHHQLALLRTHVKMWTDTLRSLPVPYDNTGADVYGCLQTASQHFQGVEGEKTLLIASPLINNTLLQASKNISLAGAAVKIIWHTCTPAIAQTCQANDAMWNHLLLHFAARSVTFLDVPQSEVEKPAF